MKKKYLVELLVLTFFTIPLYPMEKPKPPSKPLPQRPTMAPAPRQQPIIPPKLTTVEQVLVRAISGGDKKKVEELINNNKELLNKQITFYTRPNFTKHASALAIAIALNKPTIAHWLLDQGANPNIALIYDDNIDIYTFSPLYYAVKLGEIELVKKLLEHGANPKIGIRRLEEGSTPERTTYQSQKTPLEIAQKNAKDSSYAEIIKILQDYQKKPAIIPPVARQPIKRESKVRVQVFPSPSPRKVEQPVAQVTMKEKTDLATAILKNDRFSMSDLIDKNSALANEFIPITELQSRQLSNPWQLAIDSTFSQKYLIGEKGWFRYILKEAKTSTGTKFQKGFDRANLPQFNEEMTPLYLALSIAERTQATNTIIDYLIKKTTNVEKGYRLTFSLNFPANETGSPNPAINYYLQVTKSPLYMAAEKGDLKAVRILVNEKNAATDHGYRCSIFFSGNPKPELTLLKNPLLIAQEKNHKNIIEFFQEKGIRPRQELIVAGKVSQLSPAEAPREPTLASKPPLQRESPQPSIDEKKMELITAILNNDLGAVKKLLPANSDMINESLPITKELSKEIGAYKTIIRPEFFQAAAKQGFFDNVLRHQKLETLSPRVPDYWREWIRPLYLAILVGDEEIINYLLSVSGLNPDLGYRLQFSSNIKKPEQYAIITNSPLSLAVEMGDKQTVDRLIKIQPSKLEMGGGVGGIGKINLNHGYEAKISESPTSLPEIEFIQSPRSLAVKNVIGNKRAASDIAFALANAEAKEVRKLSYPNKEGK